MAKVTVKAVDGRKVPREENGRRYIEAEPVQVELTTYYRRRLSGGELEIVADKPAPKPSPAVKVKE